MTYEQFLFALCLWREARGQTQDAIKAVACVIRNRAGDAQNRWPKSIVGCILQHNQFSSFSAGDPNSVRFPIPPPAGANTPDWTAWQWCCQVAAAEPPEADTTGGANFYESLPDNAKRPDWADPAFLSAHVGPFRFYKH